MRKTIEISLLQDCSLDETLKRARGHAKAQYPQGSEFSTKFVWASPGGHNPVTGHLERYVGVHVSFDIEN
tara:strand:- start:863 stop:1072 length:210 start_codon:yes stop_codon:yes gene_type:complete